MPRSGILGLLACAALQWSAPAAAAGGSSDGKAWALLVGVSDYPALPSTRQLRGPREDVQVVRSTLRATRREWGDIVVLADGVSDARALPTRAAIFAAFGQLERRVGSQDFVVVYFAGHGSQQPASDPREADGLDEIFLPRDVGKWDGRVGSVRNAITDNEIQALLDRLLARGARVWAIFDTCHSGTITRGGALLAAREIARWVRPVELGVAPALSPALVATAPSAGTGAAAERRGLVVFSAAQASETTPELRLPPGDPARKYRGLFTYALAESISAAAPATYDQLARAILTRYAAMNRVSPTPLFDGELDGSLPLNTAASVRVARTGVGRTRVYGPQICDPEIAAAPCNGAAATAADTELRQRVLRVLQSAGGKGAQRWEFVTDLELADVSLIVRNGRVWLLAPLDDYTADQRQPPSFSPAGLADAALAQRIAAYVEPIATVHWLYRLGEGPAPAVNLDVRVRECAAADGAALDLSGKPRRLVAGTTVCIALHNVGAAPLDLTLLHLGEDYSIAPVFPLRGESNRLAPNQHRTLRLDVVASDSPALDRLMALAVAASPGGAVTDFSWAAQAGVPPSPVLRSGGSGLPPVWVRTLRWIAVPAG